MSSLQKHIEKAHKQKEENSSTYARICNICGEGFKKVSYKYYDHYRKHFPEQCMKCSFCDRIFSNKAHFQQHIQSHKGIITITMLLKNGT